MKRNRTLMHILYGLPSRERKIRTALKAYSLNIPRQIEVNLSSNPVQIAVLKEGGQNIHAPIGLSHLARFSTEQDSESFIDHIKKLGYSPSEIRYEKNSPFFQYYVDYAREDLLNLKKIDAITLELCALADRFDGFYFGWRPSTPPVGYRELFPE